MKYVALLLIFGAASLALFEQTKAKPNVIIMAVAFCVFMIGLMRLAAKVPSRFKDENTDEDAQ